MNNVTVNEAYTAYNQLVIEDKEMLLGMIEKQIIDSRREALLERAKEAEINYNNKNTITGSVNEIMEFLEND